MKRMVCLVLLLTLVITLCSCASTSPEKLILGTWEGEVHEGERGYITFAKDGHLEAAFGDLYTQDGEYTLTEDTLTISFLEAGRFPRTYVYTVTTLTNDTLTISFDDGEYGVYVYTLTPKE